ncbi:hypothetical protein K1T71_010509 [Dendrolimus kikuchii]|uniref:Uncharacterized protein n=1 Tax=Dendrolimus kikuchii TaxID=765133 RepID=A0ACC1CRP7_9NEOP|nr:hypothetical protein K1T71_010509 [Dendrolimus kikuchii]
MAHANIRSLLDEVLATRGFNHPRIDISDISSEGANYTSALYTVTVKEDEELKLFVKVAVVGEELRELMKATTLYSTEQLVYTKLVNIFSALEDKHGISGDDKYVFPEFIGCNPNVGEETVILEDLIAKGYHVYSRFKSVDWEYASSAVKSLAKFHALSFAFQKDNPEEFNVVVEKFKYVNTDDSDDENLKGLWKKILESTVKVLKNDENKEKMLNFLMQPKAREDYMTFRRPLSVVVLAHGDYRTSNLLFKKDQNGTVKTVAVDYQTVHSGCPVVDLLYFIVTGTDEAFRREHYDQLVDLYHQELGLALNRMKMDVNEVYPRVVYEKELKEMMPCALRYAVVILPMVTVEVENAPQVAGATGGDLFAVAPNELFAQRLNGIVGDFVRWGVL